MQITAFVLALALMLPTHASAATPSKKVLFIGIDGLREDALLAADAPNLHALIKNGVYSSDNDVLGERPSPAETVTGPGWSTALTGVAADKHGVVNNDFIDPHLTLYPVFLERIGVADPKAVTAAFFDWPEFRKFVVPPGAHTDVHFFKPDESYVESDQKIADAATKYLAAENPSAAFVYFGSVDIAGHTHVFSPDSPKYLAAIAQVDAHIGRLLDAIHHRRDHRKENWMILVATDHGGEQLGHGDGRERPQMRNTFLIVSGAATDGCVLPHPTYNYDVATTALAHLGIAVEPEWKLDGRPLCAKAQPSAKNNGGSSG